MNPYAGLTELTPYDIIPAISEPTIASLSSRACGFAGRVLGPFFCRLPWGNEELCRLWVRQADHPEVDL